MTITLQFSATKSASSKGIGLFSRGWCSHVDAVLEDGTLMGARSDVIGAVAAGVWIRPANYETWTRTERVKLAASPEMAAQFRTFLNAQFGKPYDTVAIIAFAMARDWRKPDSWFCSELIAAALESCRWFPRALSSVANEITPRDLLLTLCPWFQ
jgi:hypothetical protein